MFPPIYQTCVNDAGVVSVLGAEPRIWPFGKARQDATKPYAVYQNISGSPENYLGSTPDADYNLIQFDIYGDSVESCRDTAKALRDAFESIAHITAWGREDRDPDTNLFHFSFDINFITSR